MEYFEYGVVGVVTLVFGFLASKLAKKFANSVASAQFLEPTSLIEGIQKNAERQRSVILEEALMAAREKFSTDAQNQEAEREIVGRLQKNLEVELEHLEKKQETLELDLNEVQSKSDLKQNEIGKIFEATEDLNKQAEQFHREFEDRLVGKLGVDKTEFSSYLRNEILDFEKLQGSKFLLEHQESLKVDAKKFASQVLRNVYSRYSPRFVWPKSSYNVSFTEKTTLLKHFNEDSPLLKFLVGETDVSLEASTDEGSTSVLKISGGAGVDKEVLRLTVEELLGRDSFSIDRAAQVIKRYRSQVENQILRMGRDAVRSLGLDSIHREICSLIGALNFRTSHRQNQYYHSLEVARLAGMLAEEVGVDSTLAKRSGILHDIGKVLDYKIEGSHAVISGDFAQKFGEKTEVVDTVLSHHDDKIVETPHAFILKSADAMSGARPGARVDMEEGYQKRLEGIQSVLESFQAKGVLHSAIMSAGREVHVFVDHKQISESQTAVVGEEIARKLEKEVQFPGQIKVTIVRRLEVSSVA